MEPADSAQAVGGPAAEHLGNIDAALNGDVVARASPDDPEAEFVAGFQLEPGPLGPGVAVDLDLNRCPGNGDDGILVGGQYRAQVRAFEDGCPGGVAHQGIAE